MALTDIERNIKVSMHVDYVYRQYKCVAYTSICKRIL